MILKEREHQKVDHRLTNPVSLLSATVGVGIHDWCRLAFGMRPIWKSEIPVI